MSSGDSYGRLSRSSGSFSSSFEKGGYEPGALSRSLELEMPAERSVVIEARRIAARPGRHISELATCLAQDPVLVVEMLKESNSGSGAGARQPIANPEAAVVHLGSQRVLELIDELGSRELDVSEEVAKSFEALRMEGRKVSIIARILAMASRRQLAEDAQTAGLFSTFGLMMACLHFREQYLDLVKRANRASLLYQLDRQLGFDVVAMQMRYLRRLGIPETLVLALDPDSAVKGEEQLLLRLQVQAASEIVLAYSEDRWGKYHPDGALPAKSVIRLLQFGEQQYRKVFFRCEKYFTVVKQEEERREYALTHGAEISEGVASTSDDDKRTLTATFDAEELQAEYEGEKALVFESDDDLGSSGAYFGLHDEGREEEETGGLTYSEAARAASLAFDRLLATAETTEDVLDMLLYFLISEGPFSRAALIVLGDDNRSAEICRAVGEDFDTGKNFAIRDPLSPLLSGLTKVRSYNSRKAKGDAFSPMGVSSFALAPLDINYRRTVVLYADCGIGGSVSFEARRIFRYVVDLLNTRLPELKGGLPKY